MNNDDNLAEDHVMECRAWPSIATPPTYLPLSYGEGVSKYKHNLFYTRDAIHF